MNEIPDIRGQDRGMGRGGGRGRGDGYGSGSNGECYCPNCQHREPQVRGAPCYTRKCPKCGTLMART